MQSPATGSGRHCLCHLSGRATRLRPRLLASPPRLRMSPEEAFSILRRFLADPRHHFLPDELSCEDRVVRTDLMAGSNQITDHYLVALVRQHGVSLATHDEALARAFANEVGLVQLVR